MNAKIIGGLISEIRKEKGLTQKELAERLNVSDKAVSKWETGRGAPDIGSLESLADVLEISVNELLAGERFPEEDILKNSDEVLVKTMRSSRKRYIKISISVFLSLILLTITGISLYLGHHWFSNIDGADKDALQTEALKATRSRWETGENTKILDIKEKGMYIAVLLCDGDKYYMVYFEPDKIFESRYRVCGGGGADRGELGGYYFKDKANPQVMIIFGFDLPEEALYYAVKTGENRGETVYIENRQVFEIHLVVDETFYGSPPVMYDKNNNPIY